ncbi:ABC transporter substrate-binding protein [Pseudoflavonifractor capillosus]|uniref:ABC transporter substrate-binding protein n=1 Tax=Pseudoflavonifractor capillosus TaxID=106588 RepID=UPI00195D9598|nr:ABC transporter substrate-binding protein [Pseudoflavonifractor capillosus]MBM6896494.1 ABC transporter substrate-binding protein [Pseudoflavonifractor capillosus]
MKKLTALTLACTMAAAFCLTACTVERMDDSGTSGNNNSADGKRVLNVCNWGEYIDENLIAEFEKKTGIDVNYQTAESNESLYSLLKTGGATYDVICPSDYMISQLIEENMLQELNYDNIPNYEKIGDEFKGLAFDPENKYTVPYTWGTLGIIYNKTMVDGEITSWSSMYDDANKGNVLLINNSRDAFGNALIYLGYSVNTTNEDEIRQAYDLIADATKRGIFQGKVMDEVFNKMEQGNAAIATYYAGDYLTMYENNPDLAYVLPEEGANWFVDAWCILKSAQNVSEAEEWINFLASTEASLANMDYIWYASPNTEALEKYPEYYKETYGEELDMELYNIMAPSTEVLKKCENYVVLPEATRTLYNDLWIQLGL